MQRTASPGSDGEQEFLQRYGHVYEHSPWIARSVHARTGGAADSWEALDAVFREVIETAGADQQLALLRAHPELACRERDALTQASLQEQSGAGLDRCSPAELDEFAALNRAYCARFGFPFIIAVAGLERAEILREFRARLGHDAESEQREALRQVLRIGRLRLRQAWHEQP